MAGAVMGAVAGLGAAVVDGAKEPEHFGQTKAATMPKDPKWRRRAPGSARGWYPVRKLADDPVPMTRQVRRQNERREEKMPIGASQSLWASGRSERGSAAVSPFRPDPMNPFGKLIVEIVEPNTEVRDPESGITSTVTDETCVRRKGTLFVTQKTYDKLRLTVQGA